jgi:hypothetical protein
MSANTSSTQRPWARSFATLTAVPNRPRASPKSWQPGKGPTVLAVLVKKEPPRAYPTWTAPASFTLHEGNFSSDGVILVTIMRSHSADSLLIFEVAEEPKVGQVRVLLDFGGNTELLHLAESVTAAELWIAKEGYRNARLEIVGEEDDDGQGRRVSPLEGINFWLGHCHSCGLAEPLSTDQAPLAYIANQMEITAWPPATLF